MAILIRVGFFGLLRIGELLKLRARDVCFTDALEGDQAILALERPKNGRFLAWSQHAILATAGLCATFVGGLSASLGKPVSGARRGLPSRAKNSRTAKSGCTFAITASFQLQSERSVRSTVTCGPEPPRRPPGGRRAAFRGAAAAMTLVVAASALLKGRSA